MKKKHKKLIALIIATLSLQSVSYASIENPQVSISLLEQKVEEVQIEEEQQGSAEKVQTEETKQEVAEEVQIEEEQQGSAEEAKQELAEEVQPEETKQELAEEVQTEETKQEAVEEVQPEETKQESAEEVQIEEEKQESTEEIQIEEEKQLEELQQNVEMGQERFIEIIQLPEDYSEYYTNIDFLTINNNGAYTSIQQEIADAFYEGISNVQPHIYIDDYGISLDEFTNCIIESIWETRNINRKLFGSRIGIWSNGSTYKLKFEDGPVSQIDLYSDFSMEVTYTDPAIIQSSTQAFNNEVNKILALCNAVNTDIEKELIIHDYLVLNAEYDYDNYLANTIPGDSFAAYGVLVNKVGVCQSYAYAMKYLLRKLNIPCDVVTGGNHAWNIIKLDGEYYFVDVTWDDPIPDAEGRVIRTHFNVTSEQLAASGHTWEKDEFITCTSEKYRFLQDTNEYIYDDGKWYYTKSGYLEETGYYVRNSLYAYNEQTQEEELLVVGSCTQINLNAEKTRIYYLQQGEQKYYELAKNDAQLLVPFVNRFYVTCLGREGDTEGLTSWSTQLANGQLKGADIGQYFINSKEFVDKKVSDDEFLKVMYAAFFGREGDAAGVGYWKSLLETGITRNYILAEFINSNEFKNICNAANIEQGRMELTQPADCNLPLTQFVYRFYQRGLSRKPDNDGLNFWVDNLEKNNLTGTSIAQEILLSTEFLNKGLSDEAFLETLYSIFFDRAGEPAGVAAWLEVLKQGAERSAVINSFIDSTEYRGICDRYGIRHQ